MARQSRIFFNCNLPSLHERFKDRLLRGPSISAMVVQMEIKIRTSQKKLNPPSRPLRRSRWAPVK
jgi:hypothetical protein